MQGLKQEERQSPGQKTNTPLIGSPLGAYLVASGKITAAQRDEALKNQFSKKGKRRPIGQVLVEMNATAENEIAMALAAQAGVPFVSLRDYRVDSAALSLLEPEALQRYQSIPIGFDSGRLVVAMAQPRDIVLIDDLRLITGMDIQPVVVTDSELREYISRYQSSSLNVTQTEEEEPVEQVTSSGEAAERPAVQLANMIFNQASTSRASDIHIEPLEKSFRVRFRIDGVLHEVMTPPRRLHPTVVSRIKVMANMDIAERRIPQDGRMTLKVEEKTLDVRVASLPTAFGEKLTLRLLDRSATLLTLQDLGFPEAQRQAFERITRLPYGFILVTGPTGSGKSTTLYAVLNALNSVSKHIITLEDPIERRLDGVNQMQVNPQAGLTYATGLRSILRNDPNIVMVGEIRDREAANIAIEAALTGHLVLATLHTNDSAGAVTRLTNMGVEPFLTASALVGVVAQRLTRVLCPDCKQAYTLSREEILQAAPDFPLAPGEKEVTLYRHQSCPRCSHTGYKGRVGIYELLIVSDRLRQLMLERRSTQEIKDTAVAEGMLTLRQHGLLTVKNGVTSLEEVLRVIV